MDTKNFQYAPTEARKLIKAYETKFSHSNKKDCEDIDFILANLSVEAEKHSIPALSKLVYAAAQKHVKCKVRTSRTSASRTFNDLVANSFPPDAPVPTPRDFGYGNEDVIRALLDYEKLIPAASPQAFEKVEKHLIMMRNLASKKSLWKLRHWVAVAALRAVHECPPDMKVTSQVLELAEWATIRGLVWKSEDASIKAAEKREALSVAMKEMMVEKDGVKTILLWLLSWLLHR